MKMTAKSTTGAQSRLSVTAAQPTSTGHGAGGAADDDVVLGPALQPQRVHEDVEGGGADGQHGREQVDRRPQPGEGGDLEGDGEDQGGAGRELAGDERPALRALHQPVDVAVDDHVDGVGAAGGRGAAEDRGDHQPDATAGPRSATTIVGTVVTSSSSMIRGL